MHLKDANKPTLGTYCLSTVSTMSNRKSSRTVTCTGLVTHPESQNSVLHKANLLPFTGKADRSLIPNS